MKIRPSGQQFLKNQEDPTNFLTSLFILEKQGNYHYLMTLYQFTYPLLSAIFSKIYIQSADDDNRSNENDNYYYDDAGPEINEDWGVAFAAYFSYFFGLFTLFTILDCSGIFDATVQRMARTSFMNIRSNVYFHELLKQRIREIKDVRMSFCQRILSHIFPSPIWFDEDEVAEIEKLKEGFEDKAKQYFEAFDKKREKELEEKHCCACMTTIDEFTPEYSKYLLSGVYFGLEKFEPRNKDGNREKFCCISIAKGYWKDYFFFLINQHTMLSCFMTVKGNPFSRFSRRLTFFSTNCFTLCTVIFLKYLNPGPIRMKLISVFVLAPTTIFLRNMLYYILVCPCLLKSSSSCYHVAQSIGVAIALPSLCLFVALLFIAALYTPSNPSTDVATRRQILAYAYSINIASWIEEFLIAFQIFTSGEATMLFNCCGFTVVGTGTYFAEKMKLLCFDVKGCSAKDWNEANENGKEIKVDFITEDYYKKRTRGWFDIETMISPGTDKFVRSALGSSKKDPEFHHIDEEQPEQHKEHHKSKDEEQQHVVDHRKAELIL